MTNQIELKIKERCPEFDLEDFIGNIQSESLDNQTLEDLKEYYLLSFNDDEAKAILDECARRFEITDSEDTHGSNTIKNSKHIWGSANVTDSQYIIDSTNVWDSTHIYESDEITRSIETWRSFKISNSKFIFNCHDIDNSQGILNSANVKNSTNIQDGFVVEDSQFCSGAVLFNCYFCTESEDLTNAMFCTGLESAKPFQIFNQPIDQFEWQDLREELEFRLLVESNPSFFTIKSHLNSVPLYRYTLNEAPGAIFSGLSKDFFGWVGTLPHYSEELFLKIFFPT